ncbi:MAG: 4'-phosphopantetheinyl transferase superfamily protein [Paludibacteraceae bacterium]|nr:4'-phosphopantetheinyl transferase superfamily protein [Paludibacteraceae bacterium]
MLYHCDRNADGEILSIWKMDEPAEDLLSLFSEKKGLYQSEVERHKSVKRRQEYLSVRVLLLDALGHECDVFHDEMGKPSLPEEHLRISISHTKGYAAILLSPLREVGLDIEQFSDKVFHVRDKFLRAEEKQIIDSTDRIQLLLCWSAKEAVYKLYEGLRPEYWEQITIKALDMDQCVILAEVEDRPPVTLRFCVFPDFVMVHN